MMQSTDTLATHLLPDLIGGAVPLSALDDLSTEEIEKLYLSGTDAFWSPSAFGIRPCEANEDGLADRLGYLETALPCRLAAADTIATLSLRTLQQIVADHHRLTCDLDGPYEPCPPALLKLHVAATRTFLHLADLSLPAPIAWADLGLLPIFGIHTPTGRILAILETAIKGKAVLELSSAHAIDGILSGGPRYRHLVAVDSCDRKGGVQCLRDAAPCLLTALA